MPVNVPVTMVTCAFCGHSWAPRKVEVRRCPRCQKPVEPVEPVEPIGIPKST